MRTHEGAIMEAFGIMGMSLGAMGFIFGVHCLKQIKRLVTTLKQKGILDENYKCYNGD